MNKTVPIFTLGLMVFSVTIATYSLTKDTLTGLNTEYRIFLLSNKNQIISKRLASASDQPGPYVKHNTFSTSHGLEGCKSNRLSKHSPILYL